MEIGIQCLVILPKQFQLATDENNKQKFSVVCSIRVYFES